MLLRKIGIILIVLTGALVLASFSVRKIVESSLVPITAAATVGQAFWRG